MLVASLLGSMSATAGEVGQTKTGTKPGSIQVSDPVSGDWLLRAGLTTCQNVSSSFPSHCSSAGEGGVIFDISHLNADKTGHVIEGKATVRTVSCNPCGYTKVEVCNDRDDDGICTNLDAIDDDGPNKSDHHGTNASYDDQFSYCEFDKPKEPGSSCEICFCFADDTGDHDWDDLVFFFITKADQPNVGTVEVTLNSADHVGDNMSDCSEKARHATENKPKN